MYHHPQCRKSRAALDYLKTKKINIEIINFIKNPISEFELKDILIKLNKKPQNIIRTQESLYKSNFKGKKFTDDEWIKILVAHPKLIQRPIIVKGYKAIIGHPNDEIDNFFKKI